MKICKDKKEFLSLCDGTYMMQLEVRNGRVSMKKDIKYDGRNFLLRLYSGDEITRKILLPRTDPYAAINGASGYLVVKDKLDVKMIGMFASGTYWICLSSDDDDEPEHKIVNEAVFERHLCSQCDVIHNAVHKMLCEITGKDLEWDMAYIGDLSDCIVDALSETDLSVCYPSYISDEDEEYRCVDCDECPCGVEECPLSDKTGNENDSSDDDDEDDLEPEDDGEEEASEDEESDEGPCECESKKIPAYKYLVKLSHPVRGDVAKFSFNLINDVRHFCSEYKRIMKNDKDAPGCVVYQYDQKTDSYAQILLPEEE